MNPVSQMRDAVQAKRIDLSEHINKVGMEWNGLVSGAAYVVIVFA
jgi:hypothetical protein